MNTIAQHKIDAILSGSGWFGVFAVWLVISLLLFAMLSAIFLLSPHVLNNDLKNAPWYHFQKANELLEESYLIDATKQIEVLNKAIYHIDVALINRPNNAAYIWVKAVLLDRLDQHSQDDFQSDLANESKRLLTSLTQRDDTDIWRPYWFLVNRAREDQNFTEAAQYLQEMKRLAPDMTSIYESLIEVYALDENWSGLQIAIDEKQSIEPLSAFEKRLQYILRILEPQHQSSLDDEFLQSRNSIDSLDWFLAGLLAVHREDYQRAIEYGKRYHNTRSATPAAEEYGLSSFPEAIKQLQERLKQITASNLDD